jgi:hypothetical protein
MTPQPEADFISEEPSVKSTYCCIVWGFLKYDAISRMSKTRSKLVQCYCFLSKTQFDKGLHGTLVVGKPLQHADRHSRNQHGAQIEASQCLRRKWSGGNLQVISKLFCCSLRSSKMNHGLHGWVWMGKRPAGRHLRVSMAWTEALHTDSTAIQPLQAAHIEMRYLDLGQNLCTLLFIVIILLWLMYFYCFALWEQ